MTTGIAGSGRVAQALGRCLREAGEPIDFIASRSLEYARIAATFIGGQCQSVALHELQCDRVLIAVSDRGIVDVADSLPNCKILLHTCGAHGGELLAKQRMVGVSCGSMHPFQTFSTPEAGYRALPGCAFAVDGDPEALAWAEEIVSRLHGVILRIPADARAIYHAAAAMASNHITSLIDASSQLLQLAGISNAQALQAIGPISRAALNNAMEQGPVAALTGPVQRGDTETISRHLTAIKRATLSVQGLYRAASLQALDMARGRGIDPAAADVIESLLNR